MSYHSTHSGAAGVVHNWANELTVKYKKEHTAGSLFFEGKTIYSYGYHFPIASIVTNKKGVKAVLFTTRGYSNTTTRHISSVRAGCSQYERIMCFDPKQALLGDHERNLKQFEQEAKAQLSSLERAKKPEIYLSAIAYQKELATKYAEFFGIEKSKQFKALSYIHIVTQDGGKVANEKERKVKERHDKEVAKRRKIQYEKDLIREAENVEKFKAFTPNYNRIYGVSDLSYLRFNKETNRIETSQGIEIPIKIAERAFKWVIKTVEAGGCSGECKFKILEFEVLEVNPEFIRVGCHKISMNEVKELAKKCKF